MLNKTILVVERDVGEAKKILTFFRKHQFRNPIEVVHSKSDALDYVFATGTYQGRPDHEPPGLILLDLLTNRTQDVNILKPLQWYLRTQKIPLIILTNSPEQEEQLHEYQLGAVGLIRKPLTFTHFIEVIQYMGMTMPSRSNRGTRRPRVSH